MLEEEPEVDFEDDDDGDEWRGRVIVVTGANRGIGYETVRRLAMLKRPNDVIYLCSRSVYRGEDAEKALEVEGLRATYLQLDIEDEDSIEWLSTTLSRRHGGIDVLINNVGVSYSSSSDTDEKSITEQAEHTVDVNFFGTMNVCKHLFPLLRRHGRVVNVSSQAGHMAFSRMSASLRARFSSPELTQADLSDLLTEFLGVVKAQDGDARGWPGTFYGISKLGVTLLSQIQQKEFDRTPKNDILVNAVCPGFCSTRLCNDRGPRSPADGADVVVYAALLLPRRLSNPRGSFLVDDDPLPLEETSDRDLPVFKQKTKNVNCLKLDPNYQAFVMGTYTKVVGPAEEAVPQPSGYAFVKFYEPGYDYEKALEKSWTWLSHCANRRIQIAEVNCGDFPKICERHQICENPTIILFKDSRPVQEYKRLDFGYELVAFKRFLRPHVNLFMKDNKYGRKFF